MAVAALLLLAGVAASAQDVSLEYQVKAVYLFDFVKFIEWPSGSESGPITICVAEHNPFGSVLDESLRGELVNQRPLIARVILAPEPGCHVVFVSKDTAPEGYLRAAHGTPTLTVGETPRFISQGGIINFILEDRRIRFQIDHKAAERADLRISSHLLRLARIPVSRGSP